MPGADAGAQELDMGPVLPVDLRRPQGEPTSLLLSPKSFKGNILCYKTMWGYSMMVVYPQ